MATCMQEAHWGELSGASLQESGIRQGEELSFPAVTVEASAHPPGSSEAGTALQRCQGPRGRGRAFVSLQGPLTGYRKQGVFG